MAQEDAYSTRHIRSGFAVYALGKAISLPGSLALVFALAAMMPRPEYAAYVTATALLEILVVIGTLGIDWLAQTVIPGVRINGNATQTRRAVRLLTIAGALPYLVLGPLLWLFAAPASQLLGGIASAQLLEVYGLLLTVEGAGRSQRDQILGALLKQGAVQGVVVFRLLVLLGTALALHLSGHEVTAMAIAYAELGVSTVGLGVGLFVMHRYTRSLRVQPGEEVSLARWLTPSSFRFAANAYGSLLLSISLGGDLAIAIVARTLGGDATAAVGFALRLIGQLRRLLPVDLFWSVIRPAVIGRFERKGRRFDALSSDIALVTRINLAASGAVMVMLLSAADPLIRLVSRNNIELPGLLLAALMIQVVAHGLRRAYELTCFALNHSWLFFKASIAGTLAPALMVVLLDRMQSLFALPIAFVVAEGAFIAGLHVGLAARGYGFSGIARASAALGVAILSAAGLTAALAALLESPAGLVGAAAVGTFAYVVILNATGFLTVSELQRLVAALRQSRTSTSEPQDSLLPAHLPRREIHHEPDSTTCACGCAMTRIGEEVVEQLDYSPDLFSVERHIRGKWACTTCETPLHAPIPAQVIEAGIPTARLLAQVLVSKYADHMPLYRQEQRFRLAGVPIPRATLRDWVGICEVRLLPLVNALRETMLTRAVLHADETPVAMREPGHGITQRAYLWRSYCSTQFDAIQTVVYDFVAGGSGRNAKELLSDWRGTLVCHNYSGHTALFEAGVTEAGCMAHARRKFHELRANDKGALGQDVLELFGELYEIESEAAELDPAGRRLLRESKSRPVAETLYGWLALHRQQVADGTAMAMAIDYSLSRWGALTRFLSDPGVPIDNDRIEITLRPIALGRANWMFAGSMRNGQRAATMMSLIESARLNGHDPYAYLRDVLERLPTQPSSRIDELLPHRWKPIDAA